MKRSLLKRTTPLRSIAPSIRVAKGISWPRPRIPGWVKAIPKSQAHGTGDLQKRLWRLTSDYVRIRDWYAYHTCVATGIHIDHWSNGQAGHFKPYSKCNGIFKFAVINIHLQSAISNHNGSMEDGARFHLELRKRYGDGIKEIIDLTNRNTSPKITTTQIIDQMEYLLTLIAELPEKPEYYDRVLSLREVS